MNPSKTIPFSNTAAPSRLETNPDALTDSLSNTILLPDTLKNDVGNSTLAQLDALDSLVQQEGRGERLHGASHTSDESDELLDDYMKRFMERMTGRREEEVVAPAQPVQPSPTITPVAETRQASRAPESSVSLHQMRVLANASARSALDSHQRHQLNSNITLTFLPAAAASLTSSGLAVLCVVTGLHWHVGSAACLLVAALALAWRFRAISGKLLQDAAEARRTNASAE